MRGQCGQLPQNVKFELRLTQKPINNHGEKGKKKRESAPDKGFLNGVIIRIISIDF